MALRYLTAVVHPDGTTVQVFQDDTTGQVTTLDVPPPTSGGANPSQRPAPSTPTFGPEGASVGTGTAGTVDNPTPGTPPAGRSDEYNRGYRDRWAGHAIDPYPDADYADGADQALRDILADLDRQIGTAAQARRTTTLAVVGIGAVLAFAAWWDKRRKRRR